MNASASSSWQCSVYTQLASEQRTLYTHIAEASDGAEVNPKLSSAVPGRDACTVGRDEGGKDVETDGVFRESFEEGN